jgi:small-conductance mechanosensitive channel
VGVKYGSDPNKVIEVLMGVVEGNTRLMQEPEPYVLFQGFGESSLDFELRAWTNDPLWWILGGEIKMQMYTALTENGIEIPYPQRDLHIRSSDNAAAEALKKPPTDD